MLNRLLAHEHILHVLLLATIDYDRKQLVHCKGQEVYDALLEKTHKHVFQQLQQIQKDMHKEGLSFRSKQRIDELFTAYTFTQKGITEEIRYANIALKNQVMQRLGNYLL